MGRSERAIGGDLAPVRKEEGKQSPKSSKRSPKTSKRESRGRSQKENRHRSIHSYLAPLMFFVVFHSCFNHSANFDCRCIQKH